ncbi:Protein of unknown function [Pyronema omphalodes CBS 100304]|uniref:Uncharacterized protein n=1 Tax=Pyronema omphalodes (strain CBS 100304) TaxID=1076935 RepID=U4KU96_PYROM|nr:Protein of unknown function [Pyronema omphalodes CBS 100304]
MIHSGLRIYPRPRTNSKEIKEFGLEEGTKVYYLPDFADYVFLNTLINTNFALKTCNRAIGSASEAT